MLVAEIGQAHDGSLGILHSLIDASASSGVNAVKFQIHISEAESSPQEPFRIPFSFVDKTRFDYWKRMELTFDQWKGVRDHCDDVGVEFLATPFSNAAVDILESLGVQRYKVGSGDINNPLLLDKIAMTGKEVILSTGLASDQDAYEAVKRLKSKSVPVSVLQCTTKYPTLAEDIHLKQMLEKKTKLDCPVGLSDHSGSIYPGLAAASMGASLVEVHVTFDKQMFGPDSIASLNIEDLKKLAEGIQFINIAKKDNAAANSESEIVRLKTMFGKSLSYNKDLSEGHVLSLQDLEGKKPHGMGLDVLEYETLLGKRLTKAVSKWDFVQKEDIT